MAADKLPDTIEDLKAEDVLAFAGHLAAKALAVHPTDKMIADQTRKALFLASRGLVAFIEENAADLGDKAAAFRMLRLSWAAVNVLSLADVAAAPGAQGIVAKFQGKKTGVEGGKKRGEQRRRERNEGLKLAGHMIKGLRETHPQLKTQYEIAEEVRDLWKHPIKKPSERNLKDLISKMDGSSPQK
jgi:hypothetical protein